MDMYMSSVSNRLNDIMKSFTVIASLLLLPMLISGIWGMNFEKIPFFYYGNGFYVPLLIMAISVALMSFYFKKKKWI
jgi:magnesium transporter